jgi:hypothetical protein
MKFFKKCAVHTAVSVETVEGTTASKSVLAAWRSTTNDEYDVFVPVTGDLTDSELPAGSIDPLSN